MIAFQKKAVDIYLLIPLIINVIASYFMKEYPQEIRLFPNNKFIKGELK
jgi:hypothetical protein